MSNDADAIEDLRLCYKIKIEQKMTLVCFKEGSDEIAGINVTCVHSKDDANFLKEYLKRVSEKRLHIIKPNTISLFARLISYFAQTLISINLGKM